MRISDWSSDVCSSDLPHPAIDVWRDAGLHVTDTATMLVYCARGTINSTDGMLHPGDAWRPSSAAATLDLQSGALALVVRVEAVTRSEEHTSELQSLMRISYAVFCLKHKNTANTRTVAS